MKFGTIAIFFCFLVACGKVNLPSGSFESSFESALWKAEASFQLDKDHLTLRQKMLGDLIENHLTDKSRNDVISLLGTPSTKMDPDGNGPALSYPTGSQRESYITIDYEWLIIEFDEQDKYRQYSIRSD